MDPRNASLLHAQAEIVYDLFLDVTGLRYEDDD